MMQIEAPQLEGPWNSHVYVGFAKSKLDEQRVSSLVSDLEKCGVVCSLRTMLNDPDDRPSLSNIQHCVRSSRKCLLYVSDDYIKDEWFQIETTAAVDKAKRFSRDSLIVLVAPDLLKDKVPQQLHEFQVISCEDNGGRIDFCNMLTLEIFKEPDTKLAVLPKENIGYGAAMGYVYGYMRLILPDFRQRMTKFMAESYPGADCIKKMLIVLPEGCFCPPTIGVPVNDKNEQGAIQETGKWLERMANRAGAVARCYKSTVYKIMVPQPQKSEHRTKPCYFACELATPLMTLYEAQVLGVAHFTRDQLEVERNAFYCTLKALLGHRDNAEWDNNQYKIVYWKHRPGFPTAADLSEFLLPFVAKELAAEEDLQASPERDTAFTRTRMERALNMPDTFGLSGANDHLLAMYEKSQYRRYKMNANPRGLCLIISITNFYDKHSTNIPLRDREGAELDADKLKDLFTALKFKVEVHTNVDESTLEKLLLTYHLLNHAAYNAFVCCILSHGTLGEVYTADHKAIKIVNIADFFNDRHCPSLKGKPKMFFIQSCQTTCPTTDTTGDGLVSDRPSEPDLNDEAEFLAMLDELQLDPNTCAHLESDAVASPSLSGGDQLSNERKATLIPGHPDFFMSYATLPQHEAYRNPNEGITYYVEALCRNLLKPKELDRAMKDVSMEAALNLAPQAALVTGEMLTKAATLIGRAAFNICRAVTANSTDAAANASKEAMETTMNSVSNVKREAYAALLVAANVSPATEESVAATVCALERQIKKTISAIAATEKSVLVAVDAVIGLVSDDRTTAIALKIAESANTATTAARAAATHTADALTAAIKTDDAKAAAEVAVSELMQLTGPAEALDILWGVVAVAKAAAKVAAVVSSWKGKFQLPFHLTTGMHKLLYLAE